jgi:hypothetical protein
MGITMKRISNPFTVALRAMPILVFAFCAFIVVLALRKGALQKAPLFLIFPCLVAVGGYYAWKVSIRDLMDDVYDCGDYLVVKKHGEEDTVPLSNINYVNFSTDRRGAQRRIHLRLDTPSKFGTEISFVPPPNICFPRRSEIAEDLATRADKARSARAV